MTCAKKTIYCVIVTVDDEVFFGRNSCDHSQEICPRLPGEGYEKCKDICHQPAHAEIAAIQEAMKAGANLKGAIACIFGAYHVCRPCSAALRGAGIKEVRIFVK